MKADITVSNHGSIFLVRSHTPEAETWLEENVQDDAQYWGGALVVEHRYILDLIDGMKSAGFTVANE